MPVTHHVKATFARMRRFSPWNKLGDLNFHSEDSPLSTASPTTSVTKLLDDLSCDSPTQQAEASSLKHGCRSVKCVSDWNKLLAHNGARQWTPIWGNDTAGTARKAP